MTRHSAPRLSCELPVGSGWASLAELATAPIGLPHADGYAPSPAPALSPFIVDGAPDDPLAGSREAAELIPAYKRGRSVIAGVLSTLPLEEWRAGRRVTPARQLLTQPDPSTTRGYVMRCTIEDLVDYGRAWWLVTERDATTGKPRRATHVDPSRVSIERDGTVLVDRAPVVPGRNLLRFDHERRGALAAGARILATAAALERAAATMARNPKPQTVMRNTGPVMLTDAEVRALLDRYEQAIKARGTAYVDAVELDHVGWSSAELQLVEARRHTNAQIASLLNLDVTWLGASESGSSLTYTNRTDTWRGLVDITLRPYIDTIEQRLSADDVTERGRVVRANIDAFLRANTGDRAELAIKLRDAGLLDDTEARAIVDVWPDTEVEPA